MCGHFNRGELACGECKPGLSPSFCPLIQSGLSCVNLSVLIGTRTGGNSFCVSSSCQLNNNLKLFEPLLAYGTLIRSTRFFLTFVFMYIYRHLVHGVFALDAYIALYPLVLILASYILIELYDRNVWCIVFI